MTDERSYRGADAHLDQLTETNKIEEEWRTDERSYRGADAHLDQLTETNKIEEEWRQREIVVQKTLEIYLEEKVKGREEE
ncbi:hypothetical protein QE152_g26390 [Popillia japonica]|uniref:Uncharacterized protein n=1 Tax=Popillia japonica TaxID=7064 RepID=A0AAW1JZP8_POPJA